MSEINKNFLENPPRLGSFKVLEYDNIYSLHEHTPSCHELLFVLDGHLTLHIGGNLKFQAVPGDLLLVPAGVPHRDEFLHKRGLRVMIIQFAWDEKEYFDTVNNHSLLNLSYEVRNECRRRLEFMRANWQKTPEDMIHGSIQLHAILLLLYFDLQKNNCSAPGAEECPMQEAMRKARHFIRQNFMDQITLKQTAGHIGISPSYLSRYFHREYGVSFSCYLTSVRLEAARELLQTSSLQIAEIASRCGFSSSSYFIKVFHDHYGETPKNYAGEKGKSD